MHEEILIPLAFFATVVLIVWISAVSRRQNREKRAQLISQLIDKFSTGEEFASAMEGPEGWRLAEALSLEDRKRENPYQGLLIAGIILTCIGLAFFALRIMVNTGFIIPAALATALGIAFLIAAAAARRLARETDDESAAGQGGSADGRSGGDEDGADGPQS